MSCTTKTTTDFLLSHLSEHPRDWDCLLALADAATEAGGDGCGYAALARRRHWPWHCTTSDFVWYDDVYTGCHADDDLPGDWFAALPGKAEGATFASYPTAAAAVAAAADAFLRLPPSRRRRLLARRRRRGDRR